MAQETTPKIFTGSELEILSFRPQMESLKHQEFIFLGQFHPLTRDNSAEGYP